MSIVLVLVALILAIIELARTRLGSILAWAIFCLALAFSYGRFVR